MTKKALIVPYSEFKQSKKVFAGKKTVLVGGCFDLLHYGHLQFLKSAKDEGEYLIIALESDEFIKKNKRKIPIHDQIERAEILATLNIVDMVIILPLFDKETQYYDLVKLVNPSVIAVTEGDKYMDKKTSQAKEIGAKLKIVTPLLKEFSTRKIISDIS